MYETNYVRFRLLCPDLANIPHYAVSRADGAVDLHMRVLERYKFTTTVTLTYFLPNHAGRVCANPDLKIRIYHDARQAEVMSRYSKRLDSEIMVIHYLTGTSELAKRWQLNRFLYKWLGYCLHQGHGFPATPRHTHRKTPSLTPALATNC